ncbi:MAG: Clp protease ClpP [Prevotellaceae bacterium]|jgi:ATP-dependent protease ClpP protease subunit|nr:Clp protease ClpP [Prevotellaceae bacterium]
MDREVKIYGKIEVDSYYCAANIVSEIEYYSRQGLDIVVCIHSNGGNVIEGNMIANAIAKAGASIRIDGLAASMAAFLLPYASKVEMVDNGFIMLHEPSFNAGGTASALKKVVKQLESITTDFVLKLMAKTGKPEKEVRKWLDGENWFTASEAKEMGLVDEIIPSIVPISFDAMAELNSEVIYSRFSAQLITNKNQKEMTKESIITRFSLTGVTAESTDSEIESALESKITAERTAREEAESALEAEKKTLQAGETTIEALEKTIEDLKISIKETALMKELEEIVDTAVAEKRIAAEKKDIFLNIGKSVGADSLRMTVEGIITTSIPRISSQVNNADTYQAGSAWDKRNREIRGEK